MSDKRDKKLVEQGWSRMATVLDAEMPQKKDRKKAFIWFFIGSIALLGVVFIWVSDRSTPSLELDSQEKEVTPSSLIALNNEDLNTQKVNKTLTVPSTEKTIETKVSSNSNTSNIGDSKTTKKVIPTVLANTSNVSSNAPVGSQSIRLNASYNSNENNSRFAEFLNSESNSVENVQTVDVVINENKLSIPEAEQKNSNSNSTLLPSSLKSRDVLSISNLMSKPTSKLHTLTDFSMPIIKSAPIINKENFSMFRPYVFSGGILQQQDFGANLGAGVKYGRKLFGYAEAGYSTIKRKGLQDFNVGVEVVPLVEVSNGTGFLENEVILLDDNGSPIAKFTIGDPFIVDVLRTDYFDAEIGIGYNLINRLNAKVGLSYHRLMILKNTAIDYEPNLAQYESSISTYDIGSQEVIQSGSLSRDNYGINVGLEYMLNENFSIGLSYRQRFDARLNSLSNDLSSPSSEYERFLDKSNVLGVSTIPKNNFEARVTYTF